MLAVLLLNRMSKKRKNIIKKKECAANDKNEIVYCRTCLSTENLMSIFYSKETEKKRSQDLLLVTGLEIKMDDGLSQKICSHCIESMNAALLFRKKSRKAEKALIAMVLGKKTKSKVRKSTKAKEKRYDEDTFDYDGFCDDFQNDYVDNEEDKCKINKFPKKQPPVKRKRSTLANCSSYKCSTCNKEFKMKATYKAHMRFHTNYCVCEACGKRCRNNNQLQEHKRARHGLGRIHKCAYCEYSSATKEALTIHERRHTGERPYICDHCGASFHRRSNLVQHIAIHLPEKNFQCPKCFKKEKSKKLLQIHLSKVHREKRYRYICRLCRDTFARPGNVRLHMLRTHGVPKTDQGDIERFEVHNSKIMEDILPRINQELSKILMTSEITQ